MTDDKSKKDDKKVAKAADAAKTTEETEAKPKVRRSKRKTVLSGRIYIEASFNNTLVTITDDEGKTVAWHTAGAAGFKGSKKSTPYAAQMAAEGAAEKAKTYGFEKGDVYIKGVGHGREQALRGLIAQGISIQNIYDVTPIPHNGCRKPRTRRV
ncbi:30S ribosomal protein S11 [Candidatus Peregrinibacteria bacterium]|jgi:small subunit ribosomal protein S11|nr:30S ribosomal protein S11 [Candidatus Peregrinibacteria bacterium]MBT4631648.1 30S ribosomal protein S11 [Candidatus Peregrinibacteria bacterium]MBT5516776.1 30S ribosomal protein S11 [Candidatus Peregrinibacteria bacterium]MBT5823942.1 30S ribosomal protein S11 [Candidatus Peregrinibacteria bacterium]